MNAGAAGKGGRPLSKSMDARLFSISTGEPKRLCLASSENDTATPQPVRAPMVQPGAAKGNGFALWKSGI